jgi:hypothetical protein
VDASAAYLATARTESERRGHGERVTYRHGDFVELAESIAPADIVTLDRVINVYPDWKRLTESSAARARRLYGLVYPRDRRLLRLVIFVIKCCSPARASSHAPRASAALPSRGRSGRDAISAIANSIRGLALRLPARASGDERR